MIKHCNTNVAKFISTLILVLLFLFLIYKYFNSTSIGPSCSIMVLLKRNC